MTDKLRRVRIVHDVGASSPYDIHNCLSCHHDWYESMNQQHDKHIAHLIMGTDIFVAMERMREAAGLEVIQDVTDMLYPMEGERTLEEWLTVLEEAGELAVRKFWCNNTYHVLWVTRSMAAREGVDWSSAIKNMECEIETFRLWLAGEVYGVVVEQVSDPCAPDCKGCDDCDWVMVDSIWGFYGLDTRTNGMTDYVPEELHDMLHAAEVVDV